MGRLGFRIFYSLSSQFFISFLLLIFLFDLLIYGQGSYFLHIYFAFVSQILFVGLFLPIYISLRRSVHGHVVNYLVSDLLALFVHFLLFISGHFIPPLFLGIVAGIVSAIVAAIVADLFCLSL